MKFTTAFKSFLQNLTLITVILLCLAFGLGTYIVPQYAFSGVYAVILFFAVSTGAVYYIYYKIADSDMRKFVRYFMQLSMGKLMLYGLFMAVMFFIFRGKGVSLLVSSFACYAAFTALELRAVLKLMNKNGDKNKSQSIDK